MQPPEIRPAVRIHDGDTAPFDAVSAALERRQAQIGLVSSVPRSWRRCCSRRARALRDVGPSDRFAAPDRTDVPDPCRARIRAWVDGAHAGLHSPLLTGWNPGRPSSPPSRPRRPARVADQARDALRRLRIVATNRRIFAIRGVLIRRITRSAIRARRSTLSQAYSAHVRVRLDRIALADGTPGSFRDMRDALQLYANSGGGERRRR